MQVYIDRKMMKFRENITKFRRPGVEKGLMQDMIRRQTTFLGHVIRKDELEKVVLT